VPTLEVNNDSPVIGGKEKMTVEEIKHSLMNFGETQKRAVTQNDYAALLNSMPSYLGRPDKIAVSRANDSSDPFKFFIYLLSIDKNGYFIDPTTNQAIVKNLREYLKRYKGLNDLVVLKRGNVANIIVESKIMVHRDYNAKDVAYRAVQATKNYFKKNNWNFGQHIYVDEYIAYIMANVEGVINVHSFNVRTPTNFSTNYPQNAFYNGLRYEFKARRYFVPENAIIEVRYPNQDIFINAERMK